MIDSTFLAYEVILITCTAAIVFAFIAVLALFDIFEIKQ